MASVSILRSIANNTPYTLSIRNGESKSDLFSIGAQSAWNGCMNVPWIGKVSENYKAIELVMGAKAETTLWLFQDYWEPAHENAVTYLFGTEMDYTGGTLEVPGNNRGGGNHNLIISLEGNRFTLKMM